jgi:hypothetical protein
MPRFFCSVASTVSGSRGPGASRLPLRVTLGVLVTRLVVQPALLTAMVVGALALRLFEAPDPMFLLTILLSNATPTAITMLVGGGVVGWVDGQRVRFPAEGSAVLWGRCDQG